MSYWKREYLTMPRKVEEGGKAIGDKVDKYEEPLEEREVYESKKSKKGKY